MSLAKRLLEKTDDYYRIAFEALIDIGAIKTCDIHDDFYYQTYNIDKNDIYARVTNSVKKKYGEQDDYKLFHAQVDRILKEAGTGQSDCPQCAKLEKQ